MDDRSAVADRVGGIVPIVVMSKSDFRGTVTPSDLNAETVVVDIGAQSDDYIVEGYIDLSQLANGEEVIVREYVAVDGANLRKFLEVGFVGPVNEPVVRFHAKTLPASALYRVTLTQVSGTLRSFPYAFILEVLGTA